MRGFVLSGSECVKSEYQTLGGVVAFGIIETSNQGGIPKGESVVQRWVQMKPLV